MAITKRNGKYYCRFQINGERHHYLCNGAASIKEAEKIENGFKYKCQQQQNGILPKTVKFTPLSKLFKLYISYSKNNNKGFKAYMYYLKVIKGFFNEKNNAQNIQPAHIEDFKRMLKEKKKLQNSSINRYLHILSKIFSLGAANNLITENPLSKVKQLPEKNHKIRFLTKEEEIRLFKALEKNKSYLYPLVVCALQTGMRRGEIFNLKWENINFEYGFIELLETKSGKARKIPISNTLSKILEQQDKNNVYIFPNPRTKKPFVDIKHSWKIILEEADIKDFRFHDLRHTVATRLAENNIDLVVVKEILGHSDIQTTMRYAHAVPKRKLEAIEVLNSYS